MSRVGQGKQADSPLVESGAGAAVIRFPDAAMLPSDVLERASNAFPGAPAAFELTRDEIRNFLSIIAQSLHVKRHYELFRLVQGEVQEFIPHRILVSAWGDFEGADLKIDVISAIPGVRTSRPSSCDLELLLRELYGRWLANDRMPLLLHHNLGELLVGSSCRCNVHGALQGMRSGLVHGTHNARDGSDSLYLALNTGPITNGQVSVERFRFLADLIISQLDIASRKVAAMKRPVAVPRAAQRRAELSLREQEIIDWVAKGRTNSQISEILAISEFTVKNHMRRIMTKLGASNRTEAVARFRRDARDPRSRTRNEDSPAAADRG